MPRFDKMHFASWATWLSCVPTIVGGYAQDTRPFLTDCNIIIARRLAKTAFQTGSVIFADGFSTTIPHHEEYAVNGRAAMGRGCRHQPDPLQMSRRHRHWRRTEEFACLGSTASSAHFSLEARGGPRKHRMGMCARQCPWSHQLQREKAPPACPPSTTKANVPLRRRMLHRGPSRGRTAPTTCSTARLPNMPGPSSKTAPISTSRW